MPLKLVIPEKARSPNYHIRGTHLGTYINCSAGTPSRAEAIKCLKSKKEDIERGRITKRGEPTFAEAARAYVDAGGERKFLSKLVLHFGETPLRNIDQMAIDGAAGAIYPKVSSATRNRQVYTPIFAILKRAGITTIFKRPIGGAGQTRTAHLEPAEAWRLLDAAETVDPEAAILLTFCLYTGARLSEALALQCRNINLGFRTALFEQTKNGEPRTVYLPMVVVTALANHPAGMDRDGYVFSWSIYLGKSKARFYRLIDRIYAKAKVDTRGAPIHILRHTYATWLRRYAAADVRALVDTGAWRDPKSANRYMHTKVDDSARLVDLFPDRVKSA